MVDSALALYIYNSQFPQDPGVYLIGSHGLIYDPVPQMSSNLIFISLVPSLRFRDFKDRTIESLSLQKTSKIIKSNCQPNNSMPTKPYPEVAHLHVL